MQDRQYQNLELITHMFEDENHVSVTEKMGLKPRPSRTAFKRCGILTLSESA